MKRIGLDGTAYLESVRGGTGAWYWAMDCTGGDLYEAEELFRDGGGISHSRLWLIRYPDGAVYQPVLPADGCWFGEPIYDRGSIALLKVDFPAGIIHILRFDPALGTTADIAQVPLASVADCYNLRLHVSPLTLARQPNDGTFQVIWPECAEFEIGDRESFGIREGNRLYFSAWYEDPDYREETVVRAFPDGKVLERIPGDVRMMPNGELWHLV